jgi:ketosteroid isomerase-like protein
MCLTAANAQKDKKMASDTEKAIAALEQKWIDASKSSNADALAPLLADNFVNTNADGKTIGKPETLAQVKKAKWTANEISDVKVMVMGNTAIATGNWAGQGTDADGKTVDQHERWTDTWMKMPGGKWQCVASQSTAVKM